MNLLVIDDQFDEIKPRLKALRDNGFELAGLTEFDRDQLLSHVRTPCVVLLDIIGRDNTEAGIQLFRQLGEDGEWNKLAGQAQIVFFSANATAKREWEVSKDRRFDLVGYISKKDLFEKKPQTLEVLQNAGWTARRFAKFPSLVDPISRQCELLYSPNSQAMREVWEKVLLAGRCFEPVLIQGETGTGKELIATAIESVMQKKWEGKELQPPGAGGLLAYNIGSAPTEGNLQYTELFGAIKGAFTGCDDDRMGIFERAGKSNKTIFLDEIGDAPPIIQVALLRVLQEKRIVPLGAFANDSDVEKKVEFRLITASHHDLAEDVKQGTFRQDLYYRLNTLEIRLPPLRERRDDIRVLFYHFFDKINKEYRQYGIEKKLAPDSEDEILRELMNFNWPGNVRQLETFIRYSYVTSPGDYFALAKDRLTELIEDLEPAPTQSPKEIVESLPGSPTPLPILLKRYGAEVAIAVGRLVVQRLGRFPNDYDAQAYFASKGDAVRRWLGQRGVKSPCGRGRTMRSSDDDAPD